MSDATPTKVPFYQRINYRILILIAIVLVPATFIAGTFISEALSHGIHDRGAYKEVDLKALGNFPFDQKSGTDEDIPALYRKLHGQKVLLRGFMYVKDTSADHVNDCEFVYNIFNCCFNGPPQVQERVFIHRDKAMPLYGSQTLVDVVGTLRVGVVRNPAGIPSSVFRLDVEQIAEAK
jgi:hypothetical protein